jgi:hypothetical protein
MATQPTPVLISLQMPNGIGINLPGLALVVIAVVLVIALFHGWG